MERCECSSSVAKEIQRMETNQQASETGTSGTDRATTLAESAPVDRDIGTDAGDLDRGSIEGASGGTAGGVPGAGLGGSSAGASGGTAGASDMGGVTTGLTGVVDYEHMGSADPEVPV